MENGGGDTGENTSEESKVSRVEAREAHDVACIYVVVYVDVANVSFSCIFIIVYISTVIYVTVVSRSSTSPLPSPS